MEEKYKKFIQFLMDAGWTVDIIFEKNEITVGICHQSWVAEDNPYRARALPVFQGKDLEDILDRVARYFFK